MKTLRTLPVVFQIKVWTANPQQFVEDEDDDTFSYSVRISAQDLLLVRGNITTHESIAAFQIACVGAFA